MSADTDLAPLHPGTREFLSEYADRLATIKGYPVHAKEIRKVLSWADGAEAELSRLREQRDTLATAVLAGKRISESAEARCARLREELARVAGLHERDFGHPGETPEGAATEPLGQESLDRGEALDGLSFVGGADLDGDGNGGGETGKRASGHMPNHTAYGMESKLEAAEARCARLQQALNEVKRWFRTMPWLGVPDAGSHGGHPYTVYEVEKLGYGTYRDERFLPEALAGPDTPADSQEGKT